MATEQTVPPKIGITTAIAILVALIVLITIALKGERMPTPASADADATVFSEARAMSQLQKIAARPHPTGSAEQGEVRARLVATLKDMGLNPEIQSGISAADSEGYGAVGKVQNIIVRLPGTASGKPLMLVAHYDSVPNGPGAADDGASVAAILETIRAIQHGPALKNDVICLLTDGEEAGLLGSKLFMAEHPWAKNIGLVLNFEYRGSSGPMLMFESSPGNSKLIDVLAKAAPTTVTNSLMYEIYRLLPNDTDMTSFKQGHLPGLNFAAIEQPTTYHMRLDSIEALDRSTLQSEGDIMLSLTRQFGNMPLDNLQGGDEIYFDLPGLGLVHYPASWSTPLAVLVFAAFVAAAWVGVKNKHIRIGRMIAAAFAFLLTTVVVAIVCQLVWLAVAAIHPLFHHMFFPYDSHWYLLAFVGFVVSMLAKTHSGLQRWFNPTELNMGAALCLLLLLGALIATLPGVSYLLTWPLLPMLALQAYLLSPRGDALSANARAWLLLLALIPGIILCAPVIQMVFLGCTPHLSAALGLVACLLLGPALPLLASLKQPLRLPLAALAMGAGCLLIAAANPRFDDSHPRPDVMFYALDGASGKAYWVSRDEQLDTWNKPFFAAQTSRRALPEIFGKSTRQYWVSAAPTLPGVQAPELQVVGDSVVDGKREIELRVRSQRQAPSMTVKVEGVDVLKSSIEGHPYSKEPNAQWSVDAYAMAGDWLDVKLQLKPGAPFQVRVQDETYGLGDAGVPVRPVGFVPAMAGSSTDTVRAVTVKTFS